MSETKFPKEVSVLDGLFQTAVEIVEVETPATWAPMEPVVVKEEVKTFHTSAALMLLP